MNNNHLTCFKKPFYRISHRDGSYKFALVLAIEGNWFEILGHLGAGDK